MGGGRYPGIVSEEGGRIKSFFLFFPHLFPIFVSIFYFAFFYDVKESFGVPAFARQTGFTCSSCHTAYPSLNKFGRVFRERGYRLTDAQDPEGPWKLKFLPYAIQGNVGATGKQSAPEHARISIDALQLFVGGPIARRTSVYIHLHLIMADAPGPIHEVQLLTYKPFSLPFSLRFGKFEPWYAKSPGKTILTHFGYSPLSFSVGLNDSALAQSKTGIGAIWYIADNITFFSDVYYLGDGPETFLRVKRNVLDGEIGIFINAGIMELEREVDGKTQEFSDTYIRPGLDFAIFPIGWIEVSGFLSYAFHQNPSGFEGKHASYIASYLEFELFPVKAFAVALRGEVLNIIESAPEIVEKGNQGGGEGTGVQTANGHVPPAVFPVPSPRVYKMHAEEELGGAGQGGAGEIFSWAVISLQPYIRENAKIIIEYKADFKNIQNSIFFVGTHFAF